MLPARDMPLETATIRKICDFVKIKPRTVQDISLLIKKNWRTAERYVEKIEQETGCISTTVFREGTRGALKIVYWNFTEDIHSTSFQEELLNQILIGKRKPDFSPFEIYQYVSDKKKKAYIEDVSNIDPEIEISDENNLIEFLRQASKQILMFSGNMSWINAYQGKIKVIDVIRELAKRNVSIKVLGRVSIVGEDNVKKLLAINKEVGKDIIELRHRYQPLRAIVIDNKVVKFREIREPEYYHHGELKKKIEIFYEIYDNEWIDWLQKVFWKMFSTSMLAEKRLKEMDNIKNKIF